MLHNLETEAFENGLQSGDLKTHRFENAPPVVWIGESDTKLDDIFASFSPR